jgi:glycyl-tRNA synthetase (class II)
VLLLISFWLRSSNVNSFGAELIFIFHFVCAVPNAVHIYTVFFFTSLCPWILILAFFHIDDHMLTTLFSCSVLSATKLRKAGVFSRVDDSTATIGKRYARNDELGTPYGLTVDFACESF